MIIVIHFLSFIICLLVISDVMSTIESNNTTMTSKGQSNIVNSIVPSIYLSNSQIQTPPLPPLPITATTSLPSSPAPFNEDKHIEKFYKKGKQIFLEFDQIVKGTTCTFFFS
jgi:hypothetical protein